MIEFTVERLHRRLGNPEKDDLFSSEWKSAARSRNFAIVTAFTNICLA